MKELIFFEQGFQGNAEGIYFIRNDLFKFFRKLRTSGLEPVGIKINDDWNMEIMVKGTLE